jgi:membrane protein YdbS with pleckstrin-like domain
MSSKIVAKYHAAARANVGSFLIAIIGIPLALWLVQVFGVKEDMTDEAKTLVWQVRVLLVLLLLLFPLSAWANARFMSRYVVSSDSIMAEKGFFSRTSSEIRIIDIRNITVKQSFLDRILMIGDVAFSSAAGDRDEVVFSNVSGPDSVKNIVKGIQSGGAGSNPGTPVGPALSAPPAAGGADSRSELDRLLAEQEADRNRGQ